MKSGWMSKLEHLLGGGTTSLVLELLLVTLVLEDVTLALHVQRAVKVLVDLLGVTVLLEKTTDPDHRGWHASFLATSALTEASVATLALGGKVLTLGIPGVNLGRLLDDKTVLSKLANVKAGVGHG